MSLLNYFLIPIYIHCHVNISKLIVRLTYKYHRLVTSSDRPGELPQVEKCVVDDDEEDDEEVKTIV